MSDTWAIPMEMSLRWRVGVHSILTVREVEDKRKRRRAMGSSLWQPAEAEAEAEEEEEAAEVVLLVLPALAGIIGRITGDHHRTAPTQ